MVFGHEFVDISSTRQPFPTQSTPDGYIPDFKSELQTSRQTLIILYSYSVLYLTNWRIPMLSRGRPRIQCSSPNEAEAKHRLASAQPCNNLACILTRWIRSSGTFNYLRVSARKVARNLFWPGTPLWIDARGLFYEYRITRGSTIRPRITSKLHMAVMRQDFLGLFISRLLPREER